MLTLSALKSEITADKKYNALDSKAWEAKLHERAVDVKFDDVLEQLIPMYVSKIDALRAYLMDDESGIKIAPFTTEGKLKSDVEVYKEFCEKADEYHNTQTKEQRILDKLACCLKEQQLRKDKLVTRVPHHTTYYIDYTNGNDGNDGLTTGTAWKTISKYTSVTIRSAGDIAYVRANQTYVETADLNVDESSYTENSPISVIGCNATQGIDPWSDSSDILPRISFGDADYHLNISADYNWRFTNLQFSDGLVRGVQIGSCYGIIFTNCAFCENGSEGASLGSNQFGTQFINCSFYSNKAYGLYVAATNGSFFYLKNCVFNGGAETQDYGLYLFRAACDAYLDNCTFGVTTTHDSADIAYIAGWPYIYRNTIYARRLTTKSTVKINYATGVRYEDSSLQPPFLYAEDYDYETGDPTYGKHIIMSGTGIITKETSSPRSGGSASYAKMLPNIECHSDIALVLGTPFSGFAPKWLTKDVEYTVTVYARVGSAWDSALSASEAYLKCSYLSNASTAARTEIQSTETITNDGEWTAFTVTFTPLQTGFAYFWFYLAEYEDASEYIDVDDEPVVS